MGIFVIAAMILGIFYVGLSIGFMPARSTRRFRGLGTLLVSSVLAIALWQSAQSITAPSAGATILIFFCVLAIFFIGGLGRLAGSLTRQLPAGSRTIRLTGASVIVVPAALIGWSIYAYETNRIADEKAEVAALAAFQSQTLTGSFGGHSIALPVVPSLHIVHACRDVTRDCHTHFWRSTGLNMASLDAFELFSIRFRIDDAIIEVLASWCAKRQQMLDTVWCEGPLEHETGLSLTESKGPLDPNIYTVHQAPDRINSIVCSEHWTGLSCHVKFDVAAGIEGYIFTSGLTPEVAGDEALKAIPRINRIWAAMSAHR